MEWWSENGITGPVSAARVQFLASPQDPAKIHGGRSPSLPNATWTVLWSHPEGFLMPGKYGLPAPPEMPFKGKKQSFLVFPSKSQMTFLCLKASILRPEEAVCGLRIRPEGTGSKSTYKQSGPVFIFTENKISQVIPLAGGMRVSLHKMLLAASSGQQQLPVHALEKSRLLVSW